MSQDTNPRTQDTNLRSQDTTPGRSSIADATTAFNNGSKLSPSEFTLVLLAVGGWTAAGVMCFVIPTCYWMMIHGLALFGLVSILKQKETLTRQWPVVNHLFSNVALASKQLVAHSQKELLSQKDLPSQKQMPIATTT